DRRFSVADLTTTKLDEAWTKEKINQLVEEISDPSSPTIRNFGYWLMYRKPKIAKDTFYYYRGVHFYRLCYATMSEWQKLIIDEVELQMLYKERSNGHRFPQPSKVEDVLKNYRDEGKYYVGEIYKEESSWWIRVNPKFIKNQDNTGINWSELL